MRALYEVWLKEIFDNNKVLHWYPFTHIAGLMLSEPYRNRQPHTYLNGFSRAFLGCGAGLRSFQIENEGGNIYACTEMMGNPSVRMGSISEGFTREPMHLGELNATKACVRCAVLNICGGRCHNFFSEEYCEINRQRIAWIREDITKIILKIRQKELKISDFFPADSSCTFIESAI